MSCPTCGIDHHAEQVSTQAEVMQAEAERVEVHEEGQTERNTDDNNTRLEIAKVEAAAAVDIAEAQAEADVATAAVLAEALTDDDEEDDVSEPDDPPDDPAEEEPASDAVTEVDVPPQIQEGAGHKEAAPAKRAVTTSRFNARRQHR